MITLSDFITDSGHHSDTPAWWNFEFPCGRAANVWLSQEPFRFDMEVDRDTSGDLGMDTFTALTSTEVEEKLRALAELPADEQRVMDSVARVIGRLA